MQICTVCAFISVIELPRIPAYYPKISTLILTRLEFNTSSFLSATAVILTLSSSYTNFLLFSTVCARIKIEKLSDLGIPYGYIKVFPKDLHKVPEGLSCGLAFEEFINLEGIKALLLCIEHSLKQKGMTLEETLKEAKKQKGGAFYGTFKEL